MKNSITSILIGLSFTLSLVRAEVPTKINPDFSQEITSTDNIEIRVYQGKDGKFSLYEDEGTNYNYEKGLFSTISFDYNDAEDMLTIGNRKGSFEGVLINRTFRIIAIGKSISEPKAVKYNGTKTVVKL